MKNMEQEIKAVSATPIPVNTLHFQFSLLFSLCLCASVVQFFALVTIGIALPSRLSDKLPAARAAFLGGCRCRPLLQ